MPRLTKPMGAASTLLSPAYLDSHGVDGVDGVSFNLETSKLIRRRIEVYRYQLGD